MKKTRYLQTAVIVSTALAVIAAVGIWPGSQTALVSAAHPSLPNIPVIDAGHGGMDGGAISAEGLRESDLNLAVAIKLDILFRFYGIPSVMLRQDDTMLHSPGGSIRSRKNDDLRNRARLVNDTPGAMLISIHQNTFPQRSVHGAQTFYNTHGRAGEWAEITQHALRAALDPNNTRVHKPAPGSLYLYSHVNAPAILVECGFLSNPAEAARLAQRGTQRRLALAVLAGYFQFMAKSM
jgi:N-acetylmuramoyl-L-alanine amidase